MMDFPVRENKKILFSWTNCTDQCLIDVFQNVTWDNWNKHNMAEGVYVNVQIALKKIVSLNQM